MVHITLLVFSLICFVGVTYGMKCTIAMNKGFFMEVHDMFISDCPVMTECCIKNGLPECCSISEYLGLHGLQLIFFLAIATAIIIMMTVLMFCYACSDNDHQRLQAPAGFKRMV